MRLDLVLMTLALVACGGVEKEVRETSANLRVKAKSGQVWRNDIATGLQLAADDVCQELGQSDCIDDAHRITMGGVEPEKLGIDKPIDPTSSSPIAFDRAAISACAKRLELDRAGSPVVFGPLLTEDTAAAREEVAKDLTRRLLGRDATDEQVAGLVSLHDTLAPLSTDVTSDWAVGTCVVLATSVEALFY